MYNKKNFICNLILSLLFWNTVLPGTISADDSGKFKEITIQGEKQLVITADLYETGNKAAPTILLFHQARSSRGEYRQIAPELVKMGFNCLAVDARSGGTDKWNNIENKTALKANELKLSTSYLAAYTDLEAALKWLKDNGYIGKIIAWGSSYSSTLVFKLGSDHNKDINGILSFSPGEYYSESDTLVAGWAKRVDGIPCYVTCGVNEKNNAEPIYDAVKSTNKKFTLPKNGKHGSSILMDDKDNWKEVKIFLNQFIEK